MAITTTEPISDEAVSAGEARQQFGELLDRADLLGQSFVVERAGRPKAAIVSMADYQYLKRVRSASKELFRFTDELKSAFPDVSDKEAEKLVGDGVEWARKKERAKASS